MHASNVFLKRVIESKDETIKGFEAWSWKKRGLLRKFKNNVQPSQLFSREANEETFYLGCLYTDDVLCAGRDGSFFAAHYYNAALQSKEDTLKRKSVAKKFACGPFSLKCRFFYIPA